MFVISVTAILAAIGSFRLVMWVACKHRELGLATLIACIALVSLAARFFFSAADYDLFYIVWMLALIALALSALSRLAQTFTKRKIEKSTAEETDHVFERETEEVDP
ncbi:MAG: hypothetical protein K2Y39_14745 [Candidatus Obscuribacterales bacterium]|nr:hypothetical protein [Candidatus Obscuribacterales bacterium]